MHGCVTADALLIVIGHLRDFFGKIMFPGDYSHLQPNEVSATASPSVPHKC